MREERGILIESVAEMFWFSYITVLRGVGGDADGPIARAHPEEFTILNTIFNAVPVGIGSRE